MLVRSPTLTNRLSSVTVERLEARTAACAGRDLGAARAAACPSTASAIAAMWSGVVPQQPPTRLTRPLVGELAERSRPSASGVSSYSPNALGRPALG